MKIRLLALVLICTLLLTGCFKPGGGPTGPGPGGNPPHTPPIDDNFTDDNSSYGDSLEDLGGNDGYFEGESLEFEIACVSGTPGAFRIEGKTIYFTAIREESVYSISGKLSGNIIIDVGDDYKFDLELHGFSLVSADTNPITILSGDEVSITAKKGFVSYIYDTRAAVDPEDSSVKSSAIHSSVDMELAGKGELKIVSENNNGVHSKKDLQVKNLSLLVSCKDNALKGDDSVELRSATAILIASKGDCIKTTNSDISNKGNQRGTVTITDSAVEIYAACDGIDASYDAIIEGESSVSIYTDKYSNYSEEVTATAKGVYYVRMNSQSYSYSIRYSNSASGESEWINAEYHSKVSSGRTTYYYYSFPRLVDYDKIQVFVYSSGMAQGQDQDYRMASEVMTLSTAYDTISISNNSFKWTNYTTSTAPGGFPGGGGGFPGDNGNTDKGDHSTKGIKAANSILISSGAVVIKSYDDAIHAGSDTTLENGASPEGNLTVSGGSISLYSNDDGLHADNNVLVNGGNISILNSYEGIEANTVKIMGGKVSVISKDDGINATATTGTSIEIGGGELYIYCAGDGIDSNSTTSYAGIHFSGGKSVIISNSGGNSAIDSERGYKYSGGSVVAIMPRNAMTTEATKCESFASIGKSVSLSLTQDQYFVADIGSTSVTVKMPVTVSATVIILGSSSITASASAQSGAQLDANGVSWS